MDSSFMDCFSKLSSRKKVTILLNGFPFLLLALGISFNALAQKGVANVAHISDEVIQKVIHDRKVTNADPYSRILRKNLDEIETILNGINESDKKVKKEAKGKRIGAQGMLLESKVHELRILQQEIRDKFSQTREKLISLNVPEKTKEWDKFTNKVDNRFAQVMKALNSIHNGGANSARSSALSKGLALIKTVHSNIKAKKHAPSKSSSMPTFRMGKPTDRIPKVDRNIVPPEYVSSPRAPLNMVAALDGFVLAAALPTPPEAATCSYVAEDLGESMEVQFTPEILALAEKLEYTPAKIYQYVANEIEFEPYFGSLKGASGALVSKKANATDQASLLIALLRASNIPARYVQGFIGVETARLMKWIGAKSLTGAIKILTQGFIPVSTYGSLGAQIVHVWVEACIPYGNYRGTAVDNSGHRWIPLDSSFVLKTYKNGIKPNVNFDYADYLSIMRDELPHEKYLEQIEASIKLTDANNTLQDVGYIGTSIPVEIDIMPTTLPYEVLTFLPWGASASPETAILPANHRYNFLITVKNGATDLVSTSLPYPQSLTSRITLSYKPATAADQTLLDAWDGDLGNLPGTLVNVLPVIKVDGVDNAVGAVPIALGTKHNLVMKMTLEDYGTVGGCPLDVLDTSCVNMVEYNTIKAGGYHALQVNAFHTSDQLLESRNEQLLTSVVTTPDDVDATQGEFLHLALLKYYRYLEDATRIIGRMNHTSGYNGNTIGLTSSDMKVQYLFDLPYAVFPGALLIDIAGGVLKDADLSTGDPSWKTLQMWGYTASAYEHYLWQENARLEAVSTVRGLQFANQNGIPIITLDANNIANYDLLMDASMLPFKTQITDFIAAKTGSIAKVPRQTITFSSAGQTITWNGAVYMLEDSQTIPRSIGAIISGGFGGGYAFTNPAPITSIWNPPAPVIDTSFFYNATTANLGFNSSIVTGGDPVNMVNGNMYHKETDIAIKGRGLPIVFERFYNSTEPVDGPLGFGWTHSLNHHLILEDNNYDGADDAGDTDGVISAVSWIDGTGGKKYYKVTGSTSGQPSSFGNAPGIYVNMSRTADRTYTVREKNGLIYTFLFDSVAIDQKAKLQTISDRNSNTITLNYNPAGEITTVTDDLTRSLTFTYTNSRITQIQDWSGRQYQYGYDAVTGDLISFSNPLAVSGQQAPVTYDYYTAVDGIKLDHALKSYTLPRGNSMTFEYYANGKVFRHTTTAGETMTFTYNEFRGEASTTNERGYVKKYFFDPNGNLFKQIDEGGGEERFEYTEVGQPMNRTSKTDVMGYKTLYQYDPDGNLILETRPSGSTIAYSYFNEFNQHRKIKDANGNYTLYKYDASGNQTEVIKLKTGFGSTIDPTNYTLVPSEIVSWTINTYDGNGNLLTTKAVRNFSTQEGPTAEYGYNDTVNGVDGINAVSVTRCGDKDADGFITRATECDITIPTYDALGREETGVNAAWYATQRVYDDVDRITRATDGLGNLRDYQYDDNGNPERESLTVDIAGVPTLLDQSASVYDLSDRVETSLNAAGFVTYYQYDEAGNVIKTTNPDGYSLGFEYDANNRAIKAFDEEGHHVNREMDISGRPRVVTDPNGNQVSYDYYGPEKEGRLYRQYDATGGRFVEFDYDNNGNVTKVSDNLTVIDLGRTTLTTYDELNRAVRIAGPVYSDVLLGSIRPVTLYAYDNLGNFESIEAGYTDTTGTNPGGDIVTPQEIYTYNDFGQLLDKTDALNKTWRYEYDIHGNVTKITDPITQIVERTHGYGGVLETQTVLDVAGDPTPHLTTYIRNTLGQVTRVESPEVNVDYEYDTAHRLIKVTDSRGGKFTEYDLSPGGLLNYTLDSEGNETDYLYDPVGRLTGIWAPNGDLTSFIRDAGGRLTETSFTNGVNTRYQYNVDDTLMQVLNRKSNGGVISQHDYTYDAAGNRETHIENIAGVTQQTKYSYDALGRLNDVRDNTNNSLIEGYAYDQYSNRRSKTNSSGTLRYIHDAAQQLKEIKQSTDAGTLLASFSYDDNGNMQQKVEGGTTLTLVYDALDQLTQADKTGVPTETYTYGPQGRRIKKTAGTATTQYHYAGANIAAEYGTNWTEADAIYTHGPGADNPLLRATSGSARYYHSDGLGSIVATSDVVGTTSGTARYDAWGNTTASTGTIPQYGYTGREPDATGLIYYRARYYDPAIGRFTQRDPKGFIDGINQYTYAINNPINYRDPYGTSVFNNSFSNTLTASTSYFDTSSTVNWGSPGLDSFSGINTGINTTSGISSGTQSLSTVSTSSSSGGSDFWANSGVYLPSLPQGVVDAAAGFGSGLSFGITDKVNEFLGNDIYINSDSRAYQAASLVGTLQIAATGSGLILSSLPKAGLASGAISLTGVLASYNNSNSNYATVSDVATFAASTYISNLPGGKIPSAFVNFYGATVSPLYTE